MNFNQKYTNILADIAEHVVDMIDDMLKFVVEECLYSEITTESEFRNACDNGILGERVESLLDIGTYMTISREISGTISNALNILNSADAWTDWDYYFGIYGPAKDVVDVAKMVLEDSFKNDIGRDALITEIYTRIKDDLN